MIPSSTIGFDVVKARQNGRSTVCGKSFVLIHLSRQIELDERRDVVGVEAAEEGMCSGCSVFDFVFSALCTWDSMRKKQAKKAHHL